MMKNMNVLKLFWNMLKMVHYLNTSMIKELKINAWLKEYSLVFAMQLTTSIPIISCIEILNPKIFYLIVKMQ